MGLWQAGCPWNWSVRQSWHVVCLLGSTLWINTCGRQREEVDAQRESCAVTQGLRSPYSPSDLSCFGPKWLGLYPPACVWHWYVTLGEAVPERADSSRLLADSSPGSWNSKFCLAGRPGHLVSCPSPCRGSVRGGLQPWLGAVCSFCGHHHCVEIAVIPSVLFIPSM